MLKKIFLNEGNMLFAIVINAIVICALYFPELAHNNILVKLDNFFILLFLLEAIVKIVVLKKDYFKNRWNLFDLFIVVISLLTFFSGPRTSFIKILRLLRLVRLIHALRFIPHISSIVAGLGRAMKASVFVLIILFFLNFMLSILSCHLYGELVPELFGNPLIASYSIFQMFTLEGWNEIPAMIAAKDGLSDTFVGLTRFYFAMVVLGGGIFGMSLANAIFVDEMTIDNNVALENKIDLLQEQILELKDILRKK